LVASTVHENENNYNTTAYAKVPENELYDKDSRNSIAKLPMLDGRAPLRHVYDMVRLCRLLSCPMDEGRVPLSLNEYKFSEVKLDKHPMVSGIAPNKDAGSIESKC
jgi:hypothetical protein